MKYWLMKYWLMIALLAAIACTDDASDDSDGNDTETGTDGDSDADVDGDADADADTDADADADTDADTDADSDADTDTDSDTDSDGDMTCVDLAGVDLGDCEMELGVGLIDDQCVSLSGCGCEPYCDAIYRGNESCMEGCGADGFCNDAIIVHGLPGGETVQTGTMCDAVMACVVTDWLEVVEGVLPDMYCEQGNAGVCASDESYCNTNTVTDYHISADDWTDICATSLSPAVTSLTCMVYL